MFNVNSCRPFAATPLAAFLALSATPATAQCQGVCKPGEILVHEDRTHCYCKTPQQIEQERQQQRQREEDARERREDAARNRQDDAQQSLAREEWRQREAAWTRLLNMRPAESALNEQRALRNRRKMDFTVQRIENGVGKDVNFDVYAVEITRLPSHLGPEALFAQFRRDFGKFLDPNLGAFGHMSRDDETDWQTAGPAPLGALMRFRIPVGVAFEDMAVVASASSPTAWVFSPVTMHPFLPGKHPVAGNREFGVRTANGVTQIYIRAADRVYTRGHTTVPGENMVFDGGDALWRRVQDNVVAYVKSQGGEARAEKPVVHRRAWQQVQESGRFQRPQ